MPPLAVPLPARVTRCGLGGRPRWHRRPRSVGGRADRLGALPWRLRRGRLRRARARRLHRRHRLPVATSRALAVTVGPPPIARPVPAGGAYPSRRHGARRRSGRRRRPSGHGDDPQRASRNRNGRRSVSWTPRGRSSLSVSSEPEPSHAPIAMSRTDPAMMKRADNEITAMAPVSRCTEAMLVRYVPGSHGWSLTTGMDERRPIAAQRKAKTDPMLILPALTFT